ncbi:MAG: GA module-containing protein, partial [Corynebacterium sp.]|nr:GA module-containing protein [Corynebacterium sp.]
QKQSYKDAVDAATGGAAIDEVVTSATAVDGAMSPTPNAQQTAAAAGEPSEFDIAAAKAAINALSNLDENVKNSYLTDLDNADSKNKVAEIVAGALAASKKAAKEEIEKLSNLTETQKTEALNAIDNAKSGGEINTQVKDGTKQDAKNQIDSLKNLSAEEKETIKAQIDQAVELDEVLNFVTEHKVTNTSRFDDALAKAKDALAKAKAEYENVRYTNASAETKKAFEDRIAELSNLIASASETNGVDTVSAEALNAAVTNLVAAEAALDGTEEKKLDWLPILLVVGGLGVGGAVLYYLNTMAAPKPVEATPTEPVVDQPSQPALVDQAPAQADNPAQAAPTGPLAVTGASVRTLGLLALALVAAGGVFALRRRKQS